MIDIIRIRPAALALEGRSMRTLEAIAESTTDEVLGSVTELEFLIDDDLTGQVEQVAFPPDQSDSLTIVVDADFDRRLTRSYLVLDTLLWTLLSDDTMLSGGAQVIILMQSIPSVADRAYDLTCTPELVGRILFSSRDSTLGATQNGLLMDLSALARAHPAPQPGALDDIVRHRGVFRAQPHGRVHYFLFQYEPFERALDVISIKIYNKLDEFSADIVLYDSANAGPWFRSVVTSACTYLQAGQGRNLKAIDIAQILPGSDAFIKELSTRIIDPSIVVVVAAVNSGRTVGRVHSSIPSGLTGNVSLISVFGASQHASTQVPDPASTVDSRPVQYGDTKLQVNVFFDVPIRTVHENNWKVKAGIASNYLHEAPANPNLHSIPGLVSLWSLVEDYGVGLETPVPERRNALMFFPQLSAIDHWDAHWLAELVIGQVLVACEGSNRSALLIVMPIETDNDGIELDTARSNGTEPITHALRTKCRVPVVSIPRRVLEGKDRLNTSTREKLLKHRASTVVVFDESSVTHHTLERMTRLVEEELEASPDLVITLLNLGDFLEFPSGYRALFSWQGLSEVTQ